MTPVLLCAMVVACLAVPAQAYLDPATGSVVLQVVIGSVMGGLFVLKRYWGQLKARFTRRGRTGSQATLQETRPERERE